MKKWREQVTNVAMLRIQAASIAMPDAHWVWIPIGGVAAFDLMKAYHLHGRLGFDISCGVAHEDGMTREEIMPD